MRYRLPSLGVEGGASGGGERPVKRDGGAGASTRLP